MFKKIIYALVISIFILLFILLIHGIIYACFPIRHRSITFTITLVYTTYITSISILGLNLYLQFNQKYKYSIAVLISSVSSIFAFQSFLERPYRSLLLILLILLATTVSLLLRPKTSID